MLAALPRNANYGERAWHLCGVLSQLSCSFVEQSAHHSAGCAAELVEMYEERASMHTCIHTCMHAAELVEMYEDALVGLDADMHTCMHAYMHAYLLTD